MKKYFLKYWKLAMVITVGLAVIIVAFLLGAHFAESRRQPIIPTPTPTSTVNPNATPQITLIPNLNTEQELPNPYEDVYLALQHDAFRGYEFQKYVEQTGTDYDYVTFVFAKDDSGYQFMKLVSVFQDGELLDMIYVDADTGLGFPDLEDEKYRDVLETDVNFDGRTDILIYRGRFGSDCRDFYTCYLGSEDGFVYCPSFEWIGNPEIEAEKQWVRSGWRESAVSQVGNIYQFIDGEFVETEQMTWEYESRDENGTWYDQSWNVWIVEKRINGQLVVTDTFSEKDMNEAEKAALRETLKGFDSYYSLFSE